jgi:hypothetical protein
MKVAANVGMELGFFDIPHPSIAVTVNLGWFMITNLLGTHFCKYLFSRVKKLEVFQAGALKVASTVDHNVSKGFCANDDPVLLSCGLHGWV